MVVPGVVARITVLAKKAVVAQVGVRLERGMNTVIAFIGLEPAL